MSENRPINSITDRLSEEFVSEEGEACPEHVSTVVGSAAERLSDAPVQDFVPLLVENAARGQLLQDGLHMEPAEEDTEPPRRQTDGESDGLLSGYSQADVEAGS